jgi:hypothetical protein
MFQLSVQEFRALRSQTVTSKGQGGRRTSPYAFTEHGVTMLSSVLRSPAAVEINIQVVRTFVRLRQMISAHAELSEKLTELERKYASQFRVVFDAIRKLMVENDVPAKRRIGFGREAERG